MKSNNEEIKNKTITKQQKPKISDATKLNYVAKTETKTQDVVETNLLKKNTSKNVTNKKQKNNQVENDSKVLEKKEKDSLINEVSVSKSETTLNIELPQKVKKVRTKFEDLSKANKNMTIINLGLNAVLVGVCLALMIVFGINGDPNNRMLSCIFMFVLALIPFLAEIIFKFRFNPTVYLFYVIYIYVAGLWGSCLNGYGNIWWLDIAIHFFFGYVGGLIALLFLCKIKEISKLKLLSIIVICFSISMACGAMWEIAEFMGDTMFNQTAQGLPINGITAVTDTMEDIVCNFGGAILFCVHYLLYKLTNKNLGMGYIENDFNTKV